MVLPLMAILAAGVGGGAITGYAQEKQRQKIVQEEEDKFLKQLKAQEQSQIRVAQSTSDINLEAELKKLKASNRAEFQKRLDKYGLPYGTSPAYLATVEADAISQAAYDKSLMETRGKLGIAADADLGAIKQAEEDKIRLQKKEELEKDKALETHKSNLEKLINSNTKYSGYVNIPGEFTEQIVTGAGGVGLRKQKVPKRFPFYDTAFLLQSKNGGVGNLKESSVVRLDQVNNEFENLHKILQFGSSNDKLNVLRYVQNAAVDYKNTNLIKNVYQQGSEADKAKGYIGTTKIDTIMDRAGNLATSPYFGPLLRAIDEGTYKDKNVEQIISQLVGSDVIAVGKSNTINSDLLVAKLPTEDQIFGNLFKKGPPTQFEYDCFAVAPNTKQACETARTLISQSKGERMDKMQYNGWMRLATETSEVYPNNALGPQGTPIQGNLGGNGMVVLDIIENINSNSNPALHLNEQWAASVAATTESKTDVAQEKGGSRVVPDMTREFNRNILAAAQDANASQFRWLISLAQLAAPMNYGSNMSKDAILQENGFIGTDNVAQKNTSVQAATKLGITLIETNLDEDIFAVAKKNDAFAHIVATNGITQASDATKLTGSFLGVYTDYFEVLGTQAKAFFNQAMDTQNESLFIDGFRKLYGSNNNGFRWANVDLDDANIENNGEITEARKNAVKINEDGKVVGDGKFKTNREYIEYEKASFDRVQTALADIQNTIDTKDKNSLEVVEARRELLKFMMAYELASFLQGGTGGRTISDQDVENMLRAIGAKGWTTSEAIVGGTLQLLVNLQEQADLYEALNSPNDPSRVIGAIYARNNYLRYFRPNFSNRSIYDNINYNELDPTLESEKPPAINKYEFDSNNNPIINKQKKTDAIVGVS